MPYNFFQAGLGVALATLATLPLTTPLYHYCYVFEYCHTGNLESVD